jgi:nucleotide-binding universal stress UspA family protein
MIRHLLVAVDGSPTARHAARFALSLGRQIKAKVTLLTVLPPPEVLPFGPLSGYAVLSTGASAEETKKVTGRLAEISSEYADVEISKRVEIGPVVDVILDVAGNHGVDLIVVGARGHGAGRRFLLGSTSDRIVHHAHCPVTVWR